MMAAALMMMTAAASPAAAAADALWERYKTQFVTPDGRVIDFHQDQASHSEGQGFGLLLAVAYNDRQAFDTIWRWTKGNLRLRHDALFAWLWGKRPNGAWEIIDYNSATDGDILVAFALLKGYQRWHSEEYRTEALKTVADLRTKVAVNWRDRTLLLPSYYGFVTPARIVLNPSYIVFPAYRLFAAFDNRAFWDKAYQDGFYVISKSYFGEYPLPPDWVALYNGNSEIVMEKGSLFGYEAIRVILYLAQEKTRQFEKGTEWLFALYQRNGHIPRWVDLDKNSISADPATAGTYATFAAAARRFGKPELAVKLAEEGRKTLDAEGTQNYYSFSLYLLSVSGALDVGD